jgi:hypothetical protein
MVAGRTWRGPFVACSTTKLRPSRAWAKRADVESCMVQRLRYEENGGIEVGIVSRDGDRAAAAGRPSLNIDRLGPGAFDESPAQIAAQPHVATAQVRADALRGITEALSETALRPADQRRAQYDSDC